MMNEILLELQVLKRIDLENGNSSNVREITEYTVRNQLNSNNIKTEQRVSGWRVEIKKKNKSSHLHCFHSLFNVETRISKSNGLEEMQMKKRKKKSAIFKG